MKSSGNVVKTTLNTHSHSVWWTQNSFSHLSIGKIKKQAWFRFLCNKTKSPIFCFLCISMTFKTCFWYNFIRSNVIWFCTIWLKSRILQEVAVANNVTRPKIFGLVTSTFLRNQFICQNEVNQESYILYIIITDEFALFIY